MIRNLFYFILTLSLSACSSEGATGDSAGAIGKGGSMARFAIQGDYLYTVDNSSLKTFDVSTPASPRYLQGKDQFLTFGVETIFPMDSLLFIGTQTGMYIYRTAEGGFPRQMAHVRHITSCDPVVASGRYAYVTLNSEAISCGRSTDELQIYDISDISNPKLVHTERGFKHPKGLAIDGGKLFICDNGLKVYDVSDPLNPRWIDDLTHIPGLDGIRTYDVIPLDGTLLLTGDDGFFQLDYRGDKLSLISKIEVSTNN